MCGKCGRGLREGVGNMGCGDGVRFVERVEEMMEME